MYWILFIMAAIAAVVIALVIGGLATPREHVVARTMVVPASIDAVWPVVRDSVQQGSVAFAVKTENAPRALVADRLDDNMQPADSWTWAMQPDGDGTRITITQRGSVENPVVRFIATYAGHTRHLDRYLRELAKQLGAQNATIGDATVN